MTSSYPEPGTAYSAPLTEALSRVAIERTIAVPFRFDTDGYVAVAEGRGNIVRQEVLTLLMTYVGERVMMPEYGSRLAAYVFEGQDERNLEFMLSDIKELLTTNFPGVSIVRLTAGGTAVDDGELQLQLDYTYQSDPYNVNVTVTPFFQETR